MKDAIRLLVSKYVSDPQYDISFFLSWYLLLSNVETFIVTMIYNEDISKSTGCPKRNRIRALHSFCEG